MSSVGGATSTKPFPDVQDSHWIRHLRQPPRCQAIATANAVMTTGVSTVVPFGFASYNFGGPTVKTLWVSTANTKITIPPGGTGLYVVGANGVWEGGGIGQRTAQIFKNGAAAVAEQDVGPSDLPIFCFERDVPLKAGDYVELYGFQTSGANKIIYGTGVGTPAALWVRWVCPLVGVG